MIVKNGTVTPITGTNGADKIAIPGNPRRRYLRFNFIGNGFFAPVAMTAASQGMTSLSGQDIELRYSDVGDLVCKEWHVFGTSVTPKFVIVEGFGDFDQEVVAREKAGTSLVRELPETRGGFKGNAR